MLTLDSTCVVTVFPCLFLFLRLDKRTTNTDRANRLSLGRTANGRIDLRANPSDTKATSGEARETTTLDPLTPKTVHKKSLAPGVPKV